MAITACRKAGKYAGICGQGPVRPSGSRAMARRAGDREHLAQPGHGRRDVAAARREEVERGRAGGCDEAFGGAMERAVHRRACEAGSSAADVPAADAWCTSQRQLRPRSIGEPAAGCNGGDESAAAPASRAASVAHRAARDRRRVHVAVAPARVPAAAVGGRWCRRACWSSPCWLAACGAARAAASRRRCTSASIGASRSPTATAARATARSSTIPMSARA